MVMRVSQAIGSENNRVAKIIVVGLVVACNLFFLWLLEYLLIPCFFVSGDYSFNPNRLMIGKLCLNFA